jgi:hypothetical protein
LCDRVKYLNGRNNYSRSIDVLIRDDKKGKVLGIDVIKVNDFFTLNDVALVDKLRYNILSVSEGSEKATRGG